MMRLLDGSDFDLLNEAGDKKLIRRIRSQRRLIFRSYLRSLRRDHTRMSSAVRHVIANSSEDRRDLDLALFRMEAAFHMHLLQINLRLVAHSAGWGNVTVAPLMDCFERMRNQAETLSPVAAAA